MKAILVVGDMELGLANVRLPDISHLMPPEPDARHLLPITGPVRCSGSISLVERTPEDTRRILAAKLKRERRQERNSINEARQGRPPDELEWDGDGWVARCRSCGNDYHIEVEASRFNWDMNMCGRNQWCIP